jgi:uncharacterized protein involved in outer membrane biogenesis
VSTPNIRELRKARARRHSRFPLWVRLLFVAAGLYALYLLLGFFVAPSIIRKQIEQRASAQLKREVTVDHVVFNPLTLSLRIEKLLVKDHDGEPLVGWARLFFNVQLFSMLHDDIHFSEIELEGFAGRLSVSKDGILNIADVLPQSAPRSREGGRQWSLTVDRLSVNRAEIEYVDFSRNETFRTHVGPTTFVLREFRTSGGPGAPGVFRATTESGESVEWTGRVALAPLRSNGEIRVSQIAVRKYAPYYEGLVRFDVLEGTVDAQLPYEFSIEDNKPQVRLTEAGVQVHRLEIAERGQKTPVVAIPSIEVSPVAANLQQGTVEIGRVALTGGEITARRDEHGINLTALLGTKNAGSAPASSATANAPASPTGKPAWSVKLAEMTAKDFSAGLSDLTTPRPGELQLRNIAFSAKRISSSDLSTPLPVELSAELSPNGGQLSGSGTVALDPLQADLQLTADAVALPPLSPWLESFANLRVTQGMASLHARVQLGSGANGLALGGSGDLDLSLFNATDLRGADLLKWKTLGIHGVQYTSLPLHLGVTEVSLAEPEINVVLGADHVLSVSTLLRQDAAAASAPPPPAVSAGGIAAPAPERFIAIDRVAVGNGTVVFTDESIQPAVRSTISALTGTMTGATSAEIDRADLNVTGTVNQSGPLSISGKVNFLIPQFAADLRLELKRSSLAPLGPYIGKFLGYQLDRGALALDSRAKVQNRRLDSTSSVVVTDFALGAATNSPDAPHVPIQLALALLRDSQGRISLDLPVQGDLADPSFAIGGVVMKVIRNLVVKAATSPFSLIGSLFGGGTSGEELSFLDFAAGQTDLAETEAQKLDVMSKALQERPGLRLLLAGSADRASDLAVLKERLLDQRLREGVLEEVRRLSPSITSADQIIGYPEAEARLIASLYHEQFMRRPTPAPTPPPPEPRREEPSKRFFLFRWLPWGRSEPAESKPAPQPGSQEPAIMATSITPEPTPSVPEMRQKLVEAQPVDDRELQKLAAARVEAGRNYLLQKGVAAERVDVSPDFGSGDRRVTLQLR